jgi:hypothetical protein
MNLTVDGYRCPVMPMRLPESKAVAEAVATETKAKAEAETKAEGKPKLLGFDHGNLSCWEACTGFCKVSRFGV